MSAVAPTEVTMMPATFITEYGTNSLKYGELEKPTKLQPNQVLIRVHAVSIQPADYKMRDGSLKSLTGAPSRTHPCVLGFDCAGVIESVETLAAQTWQVGDAVFCVAKRGGLAHYTIVDMEQLARKPPNVSFANAAASITASLTSIQCLCYAEKILKDRSNMSRILITAGAGGVGHVAIQIAKHVFNATTVVATATSAKHDFVKSCGADRVIDYKTENVVNTLGKGSFDVALDCAGDMSMCKQLVRNGGVVASIHGIPDGDMLSSVVLAYGLEPAPPKFVYPLLNFVARLSRIGSRVHVKNLIMLPSGAALQEIAQLLESGVIHTTIDRFYPLERTNEAFEYVKMGRVVGRVIVECIPSDSRL